MAMVDDYDGVILGAGINGLLLGTYMARAGLRVALVERRLTYGGGLNTEEATLPGFYHNIHSINHFAITEAPWYRALELERTVPYIHPETEFAQPHRDGNGLLISPDLEQTAASLSRVSAADAQTFRDWNA